MASVGLEDMIMLPNLTEDSILKNLEERYNANLIYTFTGSILVSVNPYCVIPGIYELNTVKKYLNQRIGSLPPHIFAVADDAYTAMVEWKKNQSMIISGESGAGKTEATKLILQFLSARTAKHSEVERKIIESSPITESFGNAKTVRNNNSSRFGKYMEIHFSDKLEICGSRIVQYLLEKSRVVYQMESERNYHIFYQMFHLPDEKKGRLGLTSTEEFHYLNQSGCATVETIDDPRELENLLSGFSILGFSESDIDNIMDVSAGILHIGNCKFTGGDAGKLESKDPLAKIGELLGVNLEALEKALTHKAITVAGDTVHSPLKPNDCANNRDALSKTIYNTLFQHIVDRINVVIKGPKAANFIGVLDIFGFENFVVNSFEQFCINFTNEKLQQQFNHYIFKLEQQEYDKEQINWSKIDFVDNQGTIDLVEGKGGIIKMMDEECKMPKGSDQSYLEKMNNNHKKNASYEAPKTKGSIFIVKHYAGPVSYTVDGFLDKNKDTLQPDLLVCLDNSTKPFVVDLFAESRASRAGDSKAGGSVKSSKSSKQTVATKFKEQLNVLINTLGETEPHYVRCVKPNALKAPNTWDSELVGAQLKYAGMMETIKIRKMGFPLRLPMKDFWGRYFMVAPCDRVQGDHKRNCQNLLKAAELDTEHYQIGLTKVFLRDSQKVILEEKRKAVFSVLAVELQRRYRGSRARTRFQALHDSSLLFQAMARKWMFRSRYLRINSSVLTVQSAIRTYSQRRHFNDIRYGVKTVQGLFKVVQAKAELAKLVEEKKKREEEERKEAERRKALAETERKKLEEADKKKKEEEAARLKAEEEAKLAEKRAAELERQQEEAAAEAEMGMEELGLGSEMHKLQKIMKTTTTELDVDAIDDTDLLDQMMDPKFFGEIPDTLLTALDEIGKPEEKSIEQTMDFEFMAPPEAPPMPDHLSKTADTKLQIKKTKKSKQAALITGDSQSSKKDVKINDTEEEEHVEAMRVITSTEEPPVVVLNIEVDSYSFKTFAAKNFRDAKKKGPKKQAVEGWSKKMITGSLLKNLHIDHHKTAEAIFAKILSYMGDRPSKQDPIHLARSILQKGLSTEALRDEIYCQICKQTSMNPYPMKGWELMAFCCATFPPSDAFLKYLGTFFLDVKDSVRDHAAFCMGLLRRTIQNGTRRVTPSTLELKSLSKRQPIMARIKFMDGTNKAFLIESATTSAEAFPQIRHRLGLKKAKGWRLFEQFNNIARALGPKDFLCDSYAKAESLENSMRGKRINFSFVFKKSIYIEVKKTYTDIIERDLMFHQTHHDVIEGNLPCPKEVAVRLAALKLQIDVGDFDAKRNIEDLANIYIPEALVTQLSPDDWKKQVFGEHQKLTGLTPEKTKDKYLSVATELPLYGSSIFTQLSNVGDPALAPKQFDLAINYNGIHFLSVDDNTTKTVSFGQLKGYAKCTDSNFRQISIPLKMGQTIVIDSDGEAGRIVGILREYMDALVESAGWARALFDYPVEDPSLLPFKRGEIIKIIDKDEEGGWYTGELNGKQGSFPASNVELVADPNDKAALTPLPPVAEKPEEKPVNSNIEGLKLENAPGIKLRQSDRKGTVKTLGRKKTINMKTRLQFEKQPIRSSILDIPSQNDKDAREMFLCIMKYMGDYPHKGSEASLIQTIIGFGLDSLLLRDELLVQMVKQCTLNPRRDSLLKGWELIVIALSCFLPSSEMTPFLMKFIKDTGDSVMDDQLAAMAKMAMDKYNTTQKKGVRKLPPSQVEIDAVLNLKPILVRVYLLDSTTKAIHVKSDTTVGEAIADLNSKMSLPDKAGFGLYEVNHIRENTILPLASADYVCDYLASWEQEVSLLTGQKEAVATEENFKFLYKKKFWLPDPREDFATCSTNLVVFNLMFHQLLYDVRNSRIPVKLNQAVTLAAHQIQIKFGDFIPERQPIGKKNLHYVIPKHLRHEKIDPDDFIASLNKEHKALIGVPQVDCKMRFMTDVSDNDLYGANIFTVNAEQNTRLKLPVCWLAISIKGVSIWEPYTKAPLFKWSFEEIADGGQCTVHGGKDKRGEKGFWIRVGSVLKPEKYTFGGAEARYIPNFYHECREQYEKSLGAREDLA